MYCKLVSETPLTIFKESSNTERGISGKQLRMFKNKISLSSLGKNKAKNNILKGFSNQTMC